MAEDNITKIMQYVQSVAKGPTIIDGKTYDRGVTAIRLSNTFFLTDGCNICGHCCIPETNVYTESEYRLIMNFKEEDWIKEGFNVDLLRRLKKGIRQEVHNVNGVDKTIYKYDIEKQTIEFEGRDKPKDSCTWVVQLNKNNYACGIHPVSSITCQMPHLTVRVSTRGITRFMVTQYGRNWAIGCPVKFEEPSSEEQFEQIKESRVAKFRHLKEVADDLGIPTYLQEMIEYTEKIPYESYKDYLDKDIVNYGHQSSSGFLAKAIEESEE